MNQPYIEDVLITTSITIVDALKKLDATAFKVLFVVDEQQHFIGALSDGDIRRAIISGQSLDSDISQIFNSHPISVHIKNYSKELCKKIIYEKKILVLPVVDDQKKIIKIVAWDDIVEINELEIIKPKEKISIPVVIMAGGKGTRLAPFTDILPKPLIPVGAKTVLEHIADAFVNYGVCDVYVSVNYKKELIKAYLDNTEKSYVVHYIEETDFYGTAGCLILAKDVLKDTFFVTNCDIVVKANYSDVLNYHKKSNSMLTIISSLQHITIPYGIVHYKKGGVVTDIKEKPEYSHHINTGVYVLEPECLSYIPENTVFHMTHLIEKLLSDGKKVSMYPISEKEYMDTGQWPEYRDTVKKLTI